MSPIDAAMIAANAEIDAELLRDDSPGRCLSAAEEAAQAERCACQGADDLCACQNAPDAETRRERIARRIHDVLPKVG